ncbi:MAG TPA: hypothetical protein VI685_02335 [Candidatus Angelobacter sp.]
MFHGLQKLALLVMVVVVVQPFCPALLLNTDAPTASPAGYSDCHESIPAVPVAPLPAKKCCVAGHSQIAMPAFRFASTQPCMMHSHFSQSCWALSQSHFESWASLAPADLRRSPPTLRI